MHIFTVHKRTGTHADVLAAAGAADVLEQCEPELVSHGDRFEIRLQRPVTPQRLRSCDPGFRYLLRPSKRTPQCPPSPPRALEPVLLDHSKVRIGVPHHAFVTGTIQRVRQETRGEDRKRDRRLPYYRPAIALREVSSTPGCFE